MMPKRQILYARRFAMITLKVDVEGMSCSHCEMRIKKQLMKADGVHEAKADHRENKVIVTFDDYKIGDDDIKRIIREAGYAVKS